VAVILVETTRLAIGGFEVKRPWETSLKSSEGPEDFVSTKIWIFMCAAFPTGAAWSDCADLVTEAVVAVSIRKQGCPARRTRWIKERVGYHECTLPRFCTQRRCFFRLDSAPYEVQEHLYCTKNNKSNSISNGRCLRPLEMIAHTF
jgi:hypothetical protein